MLPADGVYAVRVSQDRCHRSATKSSLPPEGTSAAEGKPDAADSRYRPPPFPRLGAAHIGPNPTFGEHQRKLEVHLLDFQGDLYGQVLRVEFLARLRDTRRFPSPEELQEQLRRDIETVRQWRESAEELR